MATKPYELARLDPITFEHMANQIASRVLGAGTSGFAPGSDGGRDGLFEGEAAYPSETERWSGVWYIQSKFHAISVSKNPQQWLQTEIKKEIDAFTQDESQRTWPDNWIIVTNIDPSATPKSGTIDRVRAMVRKHNPILAKRTHIWGGEKILSLLGTYPEIAKYYASFVTSGQVLAEAMAGFSDKTASIEAIIRDLIVTQFRDQQFTKLEQAGSTADTRPGIHKLFVDLPFKTDQFRSPQKSLATLVAASSENFRTRLPVPAEERWKYWATQPRRSKTWFIRGGPGHGKSTLTQYMSQIQRAALIDSSIDSMAINPRLSEVVAELKEEALKSGFWPAAARIPVQVELRLYAKWYGDRSDELSKGLLTFISSKLSKSIEQDVFPGTLKRLFSTGRWLFIFDGLDEVPGDVKDNIAMEVSNFSDSVLDASASEALIVCTSRPQGYSGQFDNLEPALVDLVHLMPDEALQCAMPVLAVDRSKEELSQYAAILREALASPAIQEIMTSPLQSHIMAVVVRDGGRPPERRWQLFNNFYQVINKREANRNLADRKIANLLRDGDKLIKTLHNRLGFELHSRAEKSTGAQTSIDKSSLRVIVSEIVNSLQSYEIDGTIETLMEATTERLVLVSTPENGNSVRFDIRPLQEFFAAEYLYETAPDEGFAERLQAIMGDSHWREVCHFLISALVEQGRRAELLQAVEVLNNLDCPTDEPSRPLARSLCLGGIIAARLIREGVLESDKRTRHLFQSCTSALIAATDASDFISVINLPHSKDWMTGLIAAAVSDKSPPENIGAVTIAPYIVPENSEISNKLSDFILAQSVDYRDLFLRALAEHYNAGSRKEPCPMWVMSFLVKQLASNDWYQFSRDSLNRIFSIVRENEKPFIEAMRLQNFSEDVSRVFLQAFSNKIEHVSGSKSKQLFGLVSYSISDGPPNLLYSNWDKNLREKLESTTGLFQIVILLSKASELRSTHIINLNDLIEGDFNRLRKLPAIVVDMFTCFFSAKPANRPIANLEDLIRKEDKGKRQIYMISPHSGRKTDWKAVATAFPSFIPSHLAQKFRGLNLDDAAIWLGEDGSVDHLANAIIANGDEIPSIADISGIEDSAPRLADKLKSIIGGSEIRRSYQDYYNHKRFTIDLPRDQTLLPHLLCYLDEIRQDRSTYEDIRSGKSRGSLANLINDFDINVDCIESILKHPISSPVHFAALAIRLSSYDVIGDDFRKTLDEMLMILNNQTSVLLAPVFALLSNHVRSQETCVLNFINMSLKSIRSDLRARESIEPILSEWREITRSPVLSSTSAKLWV